MPVKMNGHSYYKTSEVCEMVGISKSTLLRWIREGSVTDAEYRNRKGWRLFSQADLDRLITESWRTYDNSSRNKKSNLNE